MAILSRSKLLPYLILLAVSATLMLPAWLVGLPFSAHDAPTHLRWQIAFAQQFWNGDLYPRWLASLNEGFGSPAFFIYPPLPHVVAALLAPLSDGNAWAQQRLGIAAFLAYFMGAAGAYLWLHALTRERFSALCGALLFTLAPYHLFLDTYYRAAYAELWAFAWAPFSLWAIHLFARHPVRAILVYTGATTGLILSHAPSCLLLPPLYLIYAALLAFSGKRKDILIWACAGSLAAVLISGAYLATALSHQDNVNVIALYTEFFQFNRWYLLSHYWPGGNLSKLSFISVSFVQFVVTLVLGVLTLRSRAADGKQQMLMRWALAGTLLLLFMMTSISAPLWKLVPLAQKIQFPWRLLTTQTMLLALVGALYVASTQRASVGAGAGTLRHGLMLPVLALLVVMNIGMAFHVQTDFDRQPQPGSHDVAEYQLAPPLDAAALFEGDARMRLLKGEGTVKLDIISPRHLRLDIDAATEMRLVVRQFFYPGWECTSAGQAPACSARRLSAAMPVVMLETGPGRGQVDLVLTRTASEKNGVLVTLAGLALLAGLCLFGYLRSRPKRG